MLLRSLAAPLVLSSLVGAHAAAQSLVFRPNASGAYDHARQLVLPPGFGAGEFTLQLFVKLDPSFPVGPATGADTLTHWSDANVAPYSAPDWWQHDNWLVDGMNYADPKSGSFGIQLYAGGNVRVLIGDGTDAGPGGSYAVQAPSPTHSILDGAWHEITLFRKFFGVNEATYWLYVDGTTIAATDTFVRTDLSALWSTWSGFPAGEEGWCWGSGKRAAFGLGPDAPDFKGGLDEVRFWNVARSNATFENLLVATGTEPGIASRFRCTEGAGNTTCDAQPTGQCWSLVNWDATHWSAEDAFEQGPNGTFEVFCPGTALTCPCGVGGDPAYGCPNSIWSSGAYLWAEGRASVTNDSLTLITRHLPAQTSCFYFQGDLRENGGAGVIAGDGLLCIGGNLRRLQPVTAFQGLAYFGRQVNTQPPVHVQAQIPAPGATREYQLYYRNAAAWCMPATFNMSNGLEVVWIP